jgi:hypothetical protein
MWKPCMLREDIVDDDVARWENSLVESSYIVLYDDLSDILNTIVAVLFSLNSVKLRTT